jgi:hypothetical protein
MILKIFTVGSCLFVIALTGLAQKNIAKFFPAAAVPSGGSANLQNLVKGYITPIAEDFGTLGNNGWYTTAEVHKQWGFDLNVTVNTININSDVTTFAPTPLTGITYTGGTTPLQTVYGKEGLSPTFLFNAGPNTGISFNGADGADPGKDLPVGALVIPTIQLGLGVFKGTDIRIRYTPTVAVNAVELSNSGIGLMHNIKQHIPGLREVPFSLSVFAGYTSLKISTDLSGLYNGSGQEGVAQTNSITAQLLVSKEIKVLSLYGGLGYNSSTTDYNINGTYQVNTTDSDQTLPAPIALTDPFRDSYKQSGIRATAGLRLKFGPITLNGDYTLVSKQSLLTAGFGIAVR